VSDFRDLPPDRRIVEIGHRAYVGGNDPETWYGIGLLQFHFLVAQGLEPHHAFLDVGCGCLRLGQLLIPYLEAEHYFGLEAEPELVRLGLQKELRFGLGTMKRPQFGFGYDFDITFAKPFDFAIAQSLFTHLTDTDIRICLRQLRTKAKPEAKFFFTFFEGDSAQNPTFSHANRNWKYHFSDLERWAGATGWDLTYFGDWGHPRRQRMVLARPNEWNQISD
jgi:hypothetical protein